MQTRKNRALWILYDFANSIVSIVFFLYFAQWIVIDKGIPDFYFNLTFTISAILLFISVPIIGYYSGKLFRRISGLRITTVLSALFYGLCSVFAIFNFEIYSLICFTIGLYFYLLSFTFYTPLINDISHSEKRGFLSGLGISVNYLGQFIGLIIALPFSNGAINFFGALLRAETLLPAVLIFFILSLPMLIFFHEPKIISDRINGDNLSFGIKNLFKETIELLKYPSVGLFLLAYFLFNDAVLTAANNFPIYMEQVWQVSDNTKTYILFGILIFSIIGGVTSGMIADKFGHKRTLKYILIAFVIIFPLMALMNNFVWFFIVTSLMGLFFGANWAVSRSCMSYIAPPGNHNLAFAYFGLAERASSIFGPIVWGAVVTGLISFGSDRYRIAIGVVTIFIILGLFSLSKVRDDRKQSI